MDSLVIVENLSDDILKPKSKIVKAKLNDVREFRKSYL